VYALLSSRSVILRENKFDQLKKHICLQSAEDKLPRARQPRLKIELNAYYATKRMSGFHIKQNLSTYRYIRLISI
jgi:hypothetical protein